MNSQSWCSPNRHGQGCPMHGCHGSSCLDHTGKPGAKILLKPQALHLWYGLEPELWYVYYLTIWIPHRKNLTCCAMLGILFIVDKHDVITGTMSNSGSFVVLNWLLWDLNLPLWEPIAHGCGCGGFHPDIVVTISPFASKGSTIRLPVVHPGSARGTYHWFIAERTHITRVRNHLLAGDAHPSIVLSLSAFLLPTTINPSPLATTFVDLMP